MAFYQRNIIQERSADNKLIMAKKGYANKLQTSQLFVFTLAPLCHEGFVLTRIQFLLIKLKLKHVVKYTLPRSQGEFSLL